MSNILFLTQVLPYPLDAGPKVRAYHMLRHLAGQHQVTLVSFTRPDDPPEATAHLRPYCHGIYQVPIRRSLWQNIRAGIKGLATGLPIVIVRDESPAMTAVLRRITAETAYDVIHADQLSMAGWGLLAARLAADAPSRPLPFASFAFVPFVLRVLRGPSRLRDPNAPSRLRHPNVPRTVLDEHNAIYMLSRRMAAEEPHLLRRLVMAREARAFARYEAAICRAYDAVLTVTEEDRSHLLALQKSGVREQGAATNNQQPATDNLQSAITVIPICVDPEAVQPICNLQSAICNHKSILHLGTMFWPPNVTGVLWFAREVLPLVRRQIPEARFVIVGKKPPPEVQALAADPRILVTGYAPDPTPYLAASDVFVVPLHVGGGMRVKILDAWLWGQPIVSTPVGAEGIAVRDGENILLAAGAAAFAAAVVRLLTDAALNAALRANGRAWVEANYSWQAVYRQVDAVYARLLSSPPSIEPPSQVAQGFGTPA
ncbi:MAG: glycosyltransferase family 4 protein [Chloroflexi bacterium]|nr:glycosyltransferase family 4 protein [Chloroflexota bacterium]